jgi:hypothetical protein
MFPNAKYNWKSIDRTGDTIFLHRFVGKTFGVIDEFLEGGRFEG